MTTIGILMFDGMEELDFVGPWEVLTMGRLIEHDMRVIAVGRSEAEVRCAKGMRMRPDVAMHDAPRLDVLIVPGGDGTRPLMNDAALITWIGERAAEVQWLTSVCSGALLLAQAGLLDDRKATTHWAVLDELRQYPRVTIVEHVRFVRDGQVVTAAGVSAGIDMALWLFGQLTQPEHARFVQRCMQYEPAPPYQAIGA